MKRPLLAAFALIIAFLACASKARAQDYLVQVSSMSTQAAAQAEADRLLGQGVPSFQRTENISERGTVHRVYLGPFASRDEAKAAADALKSSGVIKDYILRTEGGTAGAPAAAAPAPPQAQGAAAVPPAAPDPGPVYEPPEGSAINPDTPVLSAPAPQAPQVPAAQVPGGAYAPPPAVGPGGESWAPPPPPQAPPQQGPAVDGWAPPPAAAGGAAASAPPKSVSPGETVYWDEGGGGSSAAAAAAEGWPPPPGAAPAAPQAQLPAPPQAQSPAAPPAAAAPPADAWGAPSSSAAPPPPAAQAPPPPAAQAPPTVAAAPAGAWDGKANAFTALVDLSSSMLWLAPCRGGLVKAEAESTLLRKMSQRLPSRPYVAALRVFGYQQAWQEADFTTLYFGPAAYDAGAYDQAVSRLQPANAVSPFAVGLRATAEELAAMPSPRAVLMFSDFEVTSDPGDPPEESGRLRGRFGGDTRVYSFYVTKVRKARTLAASVAEAGAGKSWDVCAMLEDDAAFEAMMDEIFGPKAEPPCSDVDGDGVCDAQDVCPATPQGAPVDGRGCWIAAYSQFFDFDKAVVKSQFIPRIQYAAEIIRNNPQIGDIIIAGHTDAKGTDAYNLELGRKRAQAVKDILVKAGAPEGRLKVESFGKSRPIAENTTEEGRARNRRVEFHVGQVPPAAAQ